MNFQRLIYFLSLIPASFFISVSIPPNCTMKMNKFFESSSFVAKRAGLSPLWTCPEGSPMIRRHQVCDNFFNCRRSLGDEKICVDYGPSGTSTITFVDDRIGAGPSTKPVVPRVFMPDLDCSVPLCVVGGSSDVDLVYKAHLICRQMARETFQRFAVIENNYVDEKDEVKKKWPIALAPDSIRCSGHEQTVQECSRTTTTIRSTTTPYLTDQCRKLLAVSCARECKKEVILDDDPYNYTRIQPIVKGKDVQVLPSNGTLTSPGFPNFFLSGLDCTWKVTLTNPRRYLSINVSVMNLQEFDLGTSNETDENESACTNSYLEIGLGFSSNGTFVRYRLCRENEIGMNFTSFGPRLHIRYVSGQYRGTVVGQKGFALSYVSIDRDEDDEHELTAPMITLISFSSVAAFLLICIGGAYGFSKSKLRQEFLARRRRGEMVGQLRKNRHIPLLRMPDYEGWINPPGRCALCKIWIAHVSQLCTHYKRIMQIVSRFGFEHLLIKRYTPIPSPIGRIRIRRYDSKIDFNPDLSPPPIRRRWHSMDTTRMSDFESEVELSPLGSRFEITEIEYADGREPQFGVNEDRLNGFSFYGDRTGGYVINEDHLPGFDDRSFVPSEPSYIAAAPGPNSQQHDPNSDDDEEQEFRTPRSRPSPQRMIEHAASSIKHFLTTAAARTNRLTIPSWRTPSLRNVSTPNYDNDYPHVDEQRPPFVIENGTSNKPMSFFAAFSYSPNLRASEKSLFISPTKGRSVSVGF